MTIDRFIVFAIFVISQSKNRSLIEQSFQTSISGRYQSIESNAFNNLINSMFAIEHQQSFEFESIKNQYNFFNIRGIYQSTTFWFSKNRQQFDEITTASSQNIEYWTNHQFDKSQQNVRIEQIKKKLFERKRISISNIFNEASNDLFNLFIFSNKSSTIKLNHFVSNSQSIVESNR